MALGEVLTSLVKRPMRSLLHTTARSHKTVRKISMPNDSSNFPPAEVIVDENPMSGAFNMAMDAAMLQLGEARALSVIRIYRWSTPTVTVGYFQEIAGKTESPFQNLPIVRRLSGGGAILHDNEFTYSFVLPNTHPLRHDPSRLYGLVHAALVRLLSACGVDCCLRSEYSGSYSEIEKPETVSPKATEEPFLCFLRSNPNDIVHSSGAKIVGSAQRRRKGITLQHGSILLVSSEIVPSIPGIMQLASNFDALRFEKNLPAAIAGAISSSWKSRSYHPEERETGVQLADNCEHK